MGKSDFIAELKALGIEPQELEAQKVIFEYVVPVGKNFGKKVMMGFNVPEDYPMNCPTGPYIKAFETDWVEHPQNIHNREDWPDYRYWSRPFNEWNRTERKVKTYLAHIKNVMMTV